MPQTFQVVQCYSCRTFQVQQVKKSNKWTCKMCGEKQSIKKVCGEGTAADCRRRVQQLNREMGERVSQLLDSSVMPGESLIEWTVSSDDSPLVMSPQQTGAAGRWSCYIDHEELTDDDDDSDVCFTLDAGHARQRRNKKQKVLANTATTRLCAVVSGDTHRTKTSHISDRPSWVCSPTDGRRTGIECDSHPPALVVLGNKRKLGTAFNADSLSINRNGTSDCVDVQMDNRCNPEMAFNVGSLSVKRNKTGDCVDAQIENQHKPETAFNTGGSSMNRNRTGDYVDVQSGPVGSKWSAFIDSVENSSSESGDESENCAAAWCTEQEADTSCYRERRRPVRAVDDLCGSSDASFTANDHVTGCSYQQPPPGGAVTWMHSRQCVHTLPPSREHLCAGNLVSAEPAHQTGLLSVTPSRHRSEMATLPAGKTLGGRLWSSNENREKVIQPGGADVMQVTQKQFKEASNLVKEVSVIPNKCEGQTHTVSKSCAGSDPSSNKENAMLLPNNRLTGTCHHTHTSNMFNIGDLSDDELELC